MELDKNKKNINLYMIYKIFSADLLFYSAMSMIFMNNVKYFSVSQVVLLSSIYYISFAVCKLFDNFLIEKIGLKKSIVLGNVLVIISLLMHIICTNFYMQAIGKIFMAVGFALKLVSESTLLYQSLVNIDKKKLYAKYEGKANARFMLFEAISSVLSGYLYLINPYFPFIFCTLMLAISALIALRFFDIELGEHKKLDLSEYINATRRIFQSRRMRSILLISMLLTGITTVGINLFKAILIEFNVSVDLTAYIICGYSIFIAFGNKVSYLSEKITTNKSLTIIMIVYSIFLLGIGTIGVMDINTFNNTSLIFICICLIFMAFITGIYRILIKKYVMSFTTEKIVTKISTVYYLFEYVGIAIMLFVTSGILDKFSSGLSTIIIVVLCDILGIFVFKYAKNKFGLKPEEYEAKDINYVKID